VFVNAACDVFGVVAHHQRRDAGGDFDVLDAASQLASRLVHRFAALINRQTSDLVKVVIQQLLELEEILDALDRRRASPVGEGGLGRLGRFVHLVSGRQWYPHHRLASRRVTYVEKLAGTRALPFSSNIIE
jgi:hypothetical protein